MEETVENTLNEFYKLKNKYETEIFKNKRKIINNVTLSSKEKKSEFQKLKPKCINCKRPGGTIFSNIFYPSKNDSDEYRELRARCGIVADPCNLNITIQLGKYELLPDIIKEIEDIIKDVKKDIITDKNDILFGFTTTESALESFDNSKEHISTFTSLLEQYIEKYITITDNIEKNNELKIDFERYYEFLEQIKASVKLFDETGNHQYIRDVVNIYTSSLKPLCDKIFSLKYKENFVYYNEDSNTYHLIQNKYSIKSLEYTAFTDKVVMNDVGLQAKKQKKPGFIIESSSEEVSAESAESEKPEVTISNNKVVWSNPQYQQLWDKMPIPLKDALQTDIDWMKDFVEHCLVSKENKKPCTLVSPSNLKLPPEKLSDGSYDLGNEIYNDYFNKLSKSYQETLLSLYSEKNGKNNYSMLEDALNTNLAKNLALDRGYF
jgi:hypothetical protein